MKSVFFMNKNPDMNEPSIHGHKTCFADELYNILRWKQTLMQGIWDCMNKTDELMWKSNAR
jgi:hypothetical protein